MHIRFYCQTCFTECVSSIRKKIQTFKCASCGDSRELDSYERQSRTNVVIHCLICKSQDFFVRDNPKRILGILYLGLSLGCAYWTYGVSILIGLFLFLWLSHRYSKITICYDCYTKYYNFPVNPLHKEYNLEFATKKEKEIRNIRKLPNLY